MAGLAVATLGVGLVQGPVQGAEQPATTPDAAAFTGLGDSPLGLADVDARGTARATLTQRQTARSLNAAVRWNDFGTPASVLPRSGSLGKASSTNAVTAARAWLKANRALFGLSVSEIADLELVNNQKLSQSKARAVLFRQRFGDLTPAVGAMVTVGVARGEIAYVSSSLVRGTKPAPAPALSPRQGWLKAAQYAGATVEAADVTEAVDRDGWTRMKVTGLAQEQLARIRALALADGTVRPVIEANVVNVAGAEVSAYTLLVDAVNGDLLYRENKVEQAMDGSGFNGALTATECGPKHPFEITDDTTRMITASAQTAVPTNDIVLKIFGPGGAMLTSADTGTSPEAATVSGDPLAQGTYSVQVCPYDNPTAPFVEPGDYAGLITLSENDTPGASGAGLPYPPKWSFFATNPAFNFDPEKTKDNRVVGCWVTKANGEKVDGCTAPGGALDNLASRAPWDTEPGSGLSTMTTTGNNANTHEAWVSPLTPGGLFQAPLAPTREYSPTFEDRWNNSGCDPSELHPTGNDIDASVTNLFVAHNRMHDFSYFLGFTEENYNLQTSNFGRDGVAGDAEVGNVQAGAISGGQPSFLGRDNANQITLQDGVPGITNQYLFQPIAGAFYSPCTDGSFDMGIVGHEYSHAISNRMIGGPDEGITSEQGGAMGESWGDLTAAEYQFSHGLSNGGNIWAVGLYATGNKTVAIRDYAINRNPLTYGEYGFDTTGVEVHADGEIWNATMWRVRQALVNKYDDRFPYKDKALQLSCAAGEKAASPLAPQFCPGNRRWLQLVFDAFLLQQGATSMLDARDAMIAADRMRFGGANRDELWQAFAKSGMGTGASTPSADSGEPTPSFAALSGNRAVTFRPTLPGGETAQGRVYIGTYEARATPVADTLGKTKLDAALEMTPGTYRAVFQSPETGLTRFTVRVPDGRGPINAKIPVRLNLAAKANGAKIAAASAGSLNAEYLIDSTEATNWAGVNESGANVDEEHPFVAVDLAGGTPTTISRVVVSALLRPAAKAGADPQDDAESGSRFTALRSFAIDVCTSECSSEKATWRRVYVSKGNAFPGARPRPVAPNQTFRSFTFDPVKAAAVRLVALENQCTGFAGYAGEQDNDPINDTDCKTASDRGQSVRAAELEVFDR